MTVKLASEVNISRVIGAEAGSHDLVTAIGLIQRGPILRWNALVVAWANQDAGRR